MKNSQTEKHDHKIVYILEVLLDHEKRLKKIEERVTDDTKE
jgi:hypothetical protein